MKLVLSVQNPAVAETNGVVPTCEFSIRGGTIGKLGDNTWVLRGDTNPANDLISRQHATIHYHNGGFSVVDSSSNGTQLNGRALHRGEVHPLREGDVLFIEPYRILVSLSFDISPSPPALSPPPTSRVLPAASVAQSPGGLPGAIDVNSANPLIHPERKPPPPRPIPQPDPIRTPYSAQTSPERRPDTPPPDYDPCKAEELTPEYVPDYDPADIGSSAVSPLPGPSLTKAAATAPVPSPASTPDEARLLENLLAGAGLEGVSLSPEVAAQLGQILRIMVEGLLEVLKARQEIKHEFRLPGTTFQQEGNNPLKKSIDVEEAMHDLFVKRHRRFLAAPAAFEDAFFDIRHHQLAFLAGVHAAYDAMLQRFSPDVLRAQFDEKPGNKPKLSLGAGGRHWESYEKYYSDLTADRQDCFRHLFGDEFGRTYEETLQSLRNRKRHTGSRN